MNVDRKPFELRFAALRQERQPWEPVWKDIQKYILPTRGCFDDVKPGDDIAIDHKAMLDGEPMDAALTLASGMMSGLTSPAMPWFSLGVADPELNGYQPVRVWADQVRDRMMTIFQRSNIYEGLYSVYEELGTFGTAALIVLEDFDTVIRSMWFTIGEYCVAPDDLGRVRTFARSFWMSVENLIAKFGRENVSANALRLFDSNHAHELIKVNHLIEPNDGRDPQRKNNRNLPYRSVYWEDHAEADKILRLSGFQQFPVLCPRWGVRTTTDSYGRGAPGWRALGDSKTLQAMNRDELRGLAKAVDPPIQAPERMKGEIINALPGGVTFFSGTQNERVTSLYDIRPDLQQIEYGIAQRQYKISRYFYADLFKMLQQKTGPQMTAREIMERKEEKMTVLAPVLERVETELLDPLIERAFYIMLEAGLVPEPPTELEGVELRVEYISVLAQAQKMVGTTGIEQFANFAGGLTAVQPNVLDKIDIDEMLEEYGTRVGVPPKILRSEEDVAQIRQQRAEAEQQAAMQEQMAAGVQGAKVLSETKVDQPSALTALLGGGLGGGIA